MMVGCKRGACVSCDGLFHYLTVPSFAVTEAASCPSGGQGEGDA